MAFKLMIFPEAQEDLINGVEISKVAIKLKALPQYDGIPLKQLQQELFNYNTYLMAEQSIKPLEEDFDKYELSAVMDEKTCPVCRRMNGKVFNISDRQVGVNFPPLCNNCRCTWLPYVDDWDNWMDDYEVRHGGEKVPPINQFKQKKRQKSYNKRNIKIPEIPFLKKWWFYLIIFLAIIIIVLIYGAVTGGIIIS